MGFGKWVNYVWTWVEGTLYNTRTNCSRKVREIESGSRMIICKTPVPPGDNLQEAGPLWMIICKRLAPPDDQQEQQQQQQGGEGGGGGEILAGKRTKQR